MARPADREASGPIEGHRRKASQREVGMDEIKIDRGIPLPEVMRKMRYPWMQMEVGDSFFAPSAVLKTMKCSAYKMGLNLGRKYEAHPEAGGVRVWRTK
jgi:hypothetical protein